MAGSVIARHSGLRVGGLVTEEGYVRARRSREGSFRPRTSISGSHCPPVTWPPSPSRNDALSQLPSSFILNSEVNTVAYSNTGATLCPAIRR